MSELGPSSFESPERRHSMDSQGRVADTPFKNHQLYNSEQKYDAGDTSYDHLPDYGADFLPEDPELNYDELPDYAEDYGSPETKATTEVQRAMAEIETAEKQIADHTGLMGEALADATDQYLVDKVEHQEDFETEDAAHTVEDALIEGALEATGQRPTSEHNPIDELEQKGFDTQVTKGIERLHEQGAKLPHGESAAEVVAMAIASKESQADQKETETAQQTKNREILRDSEMGETLEKAYLGAVELDGRLADIAVVLIKGGEHRHAFARPMWSKENETGKHEIHISLEDLNGTLATFEEAMKIKSNTEKIAKTLGVEPDEVTPELFYVQSMVHEMGHTLEYMDYQEAGKTPEEHKHDQKEARNMLPIEGQPVSNLKKNEEAVVDQWGAIAPHASKRYSAHKHADLEITTFDELIDATADVYRDTPFEHAADKFAANVLAQQPELVAQLLKQAKGETVDYNKESKEAGWDSPGRVQKLVERYIVPGAKVLDIGTGTGLAIQGYAEKGATVIGLDHDTAMLDQARAVVGDKGVLRQADINKLLPISDLDGQIDVVQAVGVLEFASNLEGVIAQANISQKKGGVFAFTTEALAKVGSQSEAITAYPEAGVTVHRHSVAEVTKILHDSGYKLVSHDRYDAYERGNNKVKYNMFLAQKS
jgi:SAM-dependent methyltransferase